MNVTSKDIDRLYEAVKEMKKDIKDYFDLTSKAQDDKATERVKYFEAERDRLDKQDKELKELIADNHDEVVGLVNETIKLQKETNGRITSLEFWRRGIRIRWGIYAGLIAGLVSLGAWIIPILVGLLT